MFLAATSIEQFWNKDDELLFLGRWCTRNRTPAELLRLHYKILANPWDDRERLYRTIDYLEEFAETALTQLSEYLNKIHGVHFDQRYWRILVSPWIVNYLHVLFDRYSILTDAFAKFADLKTVILDTESFSRPADTAAFVTATSRDVYNLQLFSSLLRAMGHDFGSRPYEPASTEVKSQPRTFGTVLKHRLLMVESALAEAVAKNNAIAMCSMSWRRPYSWKLAAGTGFRFFPLTLASEGILPAPEEPDISAREKMTSIPAANEFERIFWLQLAADLPQIYLETHEKMRQIVRSGNVTRQTLMADNAWYYDESFKFFAAETCLDGGRILAVQHGGGYGISRYTPVEIHEKKIADAYFVWGWADSKPRHHNLPNPRMSRETSHIKRESSIIFISTGGPLYLLRFHSSPLGDQWSEYFEWQLRFFKELTHLKRRSLVYRPYPANLGFDITSQVKGAYPEVRIHRGKLWRGLERARLVVIDHCGTTFLETLAANIPTILYWDPQRWEVREEAMPYMDLLQKAGILWRLPEDAAHAVDRLYDNIQAWWDAKETQAARREFVKRFALQSDNWVQTWKRDVK
jgi:putative transferase (TIGR04331 family)